MGIKIVKKSRLLKLFPSWVGAFTFNQTIYLRGSDKPRLLISHEYIHTQQYKKEGVLKFLIVYFYEYLLNLWRYNFNTKEAYINISFEKEAYANQDKINKEDIVISEEVYDVSNF